MQVLDAAIGVVHLVDLGIFRVLHVDDDQAMMPGGHIGIGPRDVDRVSVFQIEMRHNLWLGQIRRVENLEAFVVADKTVPELHLN